MKYIKLATFFLFIISCGPIGNSKAQSVSDYLILQNIADCKFVTQTKDFISGQPKTIPGYTKRNSPGILAGADHFDLDHNDVTYETDYSNRNNRLSVEAQVTQHAGADSDRWLLHEVEDQYRSAETERLGLLTEGTILRKIGGNRVYWIGLGGGSFMWLSSNVVIKISYTDLQSTKPEPLEVVEAYLQKFPSTIPITLVLDRDHDEKWIKDEMERRLWLCDKWFLQLQMGKVELDSTLREVVDHLVVFLDYREKYYGVKAQDEKIKLMGYLDSKDGTAIKSKLTEYKKWWIVNKTKSINLP